MAKNRFYFITAFIFGLIFHIYYNGWFSLFLLVFLACLPFFSLLLSFSAMKNIRLSAEIPSLCTRGDTVKLTITNLSGSLFPTPVFRFQFTTIYVMTDMKMSVKVRLAGSQCSESIVDTSHCGTVKCVFKQGVVYDYLGLFRRKIKLPEPVTLAVFPRPAPPEPLPNLSRFQYRSYRPKKGGGFSEIYDMREYRPGDSMRDIHWKLSTKIDNLLVKEPQEPNRNRILLTLNLTDSPDILDPTLDQLAWLSLWLLDHEVEHEVLWLDHATYKVTSAPIKEADDLNALMTHFLKMHMKNGMPSIAEREFAAVDWRYHIMPFARSKTVGKEENAG